MGGAYVPERFDGWISEVSKQTPLWLAEPFSLQQTGVPERCASSRAVVVAAGEHENDAAKLQAGAELATFDVAQINVALLGGMVPCRELLYWFAKNRRPCVLTGGATPVEVLAMAHLAGTVDDNICLGIDWPCYSTDGRPGIYPFPLGEELLKVPLVMENGAVLLPDTSGLGVDVNDAVIGRYPWKSGPARVTPY
jgi:L-alanine-DL-glutamate epimerase-like enolase superfamily enzyme